MQVKDIEEFCVNLRAKMRQKGYPEAVANIQIWTYHHEEEIEWSCWVNPNATGLVEENFTYAGPLSECMEKMKEFVDRLEDR